MTAAVDAKRILRGWIAQSADVPAEEIGDDTALIADGYITSVRVLDLVLLLEELRGRPVEAWQIKPGVFSTLAAIEQAFFKERKDV